MLRSRGGFRENNRLARSIAASLNPTNPMLELGFTPDPWQRDLLSSVSQQVLVLCARQTGKSTTIAGIAFTHAVYTPNAVVLLLSPTQRQSEELFRKVMAFFDALPTKPPVRKRNARELELTNGSRIISLPGTEETIRCYTATLLLIDEAARVPDELFAAVRPMLATSSGRLICLSTPFGKRGFFYEAFVNGGATWQRFKVTAEQCPRISAQFLEEERRIHSTLWVAQEYGCEFVSTFSQVFDPDLIMAAFDDDVYAFSWE